MAYISTYPSIKCTELTFMSKEEENEIRNSYEVKKAVNAARKGDLEGKKKNYFRLVNGTSLEQRAWRQDVWLVESGLLLLDFDIKDDPNNAYNNVHSIFIRHLEEWGIVHMEESARGGAHITVRRTEGLTPKQNARLFELRTNLTIDKNGLNLCKACFLVPTDMVHYVDEDLYYSMTPIPFLPLSEEDKAMIEKDEVEQENIHQEQIQIRKTTAQPFVYTTDDAEALRLLIQQIETAQVDIIRTYDRWVNVGFIIGNILGRAGLQEFLTLSLLFNHYSTEEAIDKYEHLLSDSRHELGLGTLLMYAREEGVIL